MTPTKQGQICKIKTPQPDENPLEAYIVTEDLSQKDDSVLTLVVSITDLQRNIANPAIAPRKAIRKSELEVIADSLTTYVESWNNI